MNSFQILEDGKGRSGLADQSKFTQFSVSVDVLKIFFINLEVFICTCQKAGVFSFPGCIRNVRVHDDEFGTPIKETNTTPCSAAYETGTFFSSSGGYVQQCK